jgi:hypothetical protein
VITIASIASALGVIRVEWPNIEEDFVLFWQQVSFTKNICNSGIQHNAVNKNKPK